jgi:hypothetical protein
MDIMMKIQQMNMDMMKEMNESNKEMFKAMQEQIKDIAKEKRSSGNEEKAPSAMEMYKMLKDAESSGFEQMRLLNDLAKEQAEERDALRGGNSDNPAEKESTLDTVLKSMIPVLASKMAGGPTQAASAPAPRVQRPTTVLPPERRAVSQGNSNRSHESTANRTSVQTNQARAHDGNNKQSEAGVRSSQGALLTAPAIEAPKSASSFLNAGDDLNFGTKASPANTEERISSANTSSKDQANAEAILTIVAPIAIDGYTTEGSSLDMIADKSIAELQNQGIDLTTVQRDFDDETLSGIISSLPDDLQTLTRDLRNVIVTKISSMSR